MRIAIISDLHSNLEATISVMDEINRQSIDEIICLGDIVGYAANPNECCEIVKKHCSFVVMGNHDAGVVGLTPLKYFNEIAASACLWTTKKITLENIEWIKKLPILKNNDPKEYIITHSTPSNPKIWNYIISIEDAIYEFNFFNKKICFVGHSHIPVGFVKKNDKYKIIDKEKFTIEEDSKYIINPGSVGQPRDRNPDACFGIYDTDKEEFEIIHIPYDIKKAQAKIIEAGLHKFLAYRLMEGI